MRRFSGSVEVDVGDDTFVVEAVYYPGTPGGYWDPPEPGEIELADQVEVYAADGGRMTINLDELIKIYSTYHDVPEQQAERMIEGACSERMMAKLEDAYDE